MASRLGESIVGKFGREVTHMSHSKAERDDSKSRIGYPGTDEFSDPETIIAVVRDEDPDEFEITVEGQEDDLQKVMTTCDPMDHQSEQEAIDDPLVVFPPVENDDQIVDNGDIYRVTSHRKDRRNGVSHFVLIEDSRDPYTDSGTIGPDSNS